MVVGGGAAGGGGGGHLEDPSGGGGEPRGSVPRPRRWLGDLPQPSVPLGDDSTGAGRRLRALAARHGGVAVRYLRCMNGGHRDGNLPATLSPATCQRSVCWHALSNREGQRRHFSRRWRAHISGRARANISAGDRARLPRCRRRQANGEYAGARSAIGRGSDGILVGDGVRTVQLAIARARTFQAAIASANFSRCRQ